MLFATPVMLHSSLVSVPIMWCVIILFIRTALEDHTLRAELPGYQEYSLRVWLPFDSWFVVVSKPILVHSVGPTLDQPKRIARSTPCVRPYQTEVRKADLFHQPIGSISFLD